MSLLLDFLQFLLISLDVPPSRGKFFAETSAKRLSTYGAQESGRAERGGGKKMPFLGPKDAFF